MNVYRRGEDTLFGEGQVGGLRGKHSAGVTGVT
jgi:hypothetical protein